MVADGTHGQKPSASGALGSAAFTAASAYAASNAATTVNSQTCTLGSTCTIPFQTNGSSNTSQAGINLLTSTTNSVGLTVTPTNSATNAEKFEITGTYSGAISSSQVTTGLGYTPANCTAGTTGSDCLTLTSGYVPVANLPAATPTAAGVSTQIANTTVAISSGTQGANSCSSTTNITMTGVNPTGAAACTGAGCLLQYNYQSTPGSLVGWGSVGGMSFDIVPTPSVANSATWEICNRTVSSITYSAVTFIVGGK
jgi:hypothetical protein